MPGALERKPYDDERGLGHMTEEAENRHDHESGDTCSHQELEDAWGRGPLEPPEGDRPAHSWISDFWPSELREDLFLVFEAPQVVVLHFGSPGKLTWGGEDGDQSLILLTPRGKSGPHQKCGELARGLKTQGKPTS